MSLNWVTVKKESENENRLDVANVGQYARAEIYGAGNYWAVRCTLGRMFDEQVIGTIEQAREKIENKLREFVQAITDSLEGKDQIKDGVINAGY